MWSYLYGFITDYGINARHALLLETIGVLQLEIEAHQKIGLYVWIFVPIIIVMTIMQFGFFTLYNGQFHPFNKIITLTNPGRGWGSKFGQNGFFFIFTFLAIPSIKSKLQKSTIRRINCKNLTNLVYFIIYINKMARNMSKMVIYEGDFCYIF